MPLNYQKPKIRNPIISKLTNTISQVFNYIRPDIILGVFLITAIVFSSLQIKAWGFYSVFGIFVIGYFAERILFKYARTKKQN